MNFTKEFRNRSNLEKLTFFMNVNQMILQKSKYRCYNFVAH